MCINLGNCALIQGLVSPLFQIALGSLIESNAGIVAVTVAAACILGFLAHVLAPARFRFDSPKLKLVRIRVLTLLTLHS